MATESFLNLAAATASLVDVDLNRKTRVDAILWREEDLAFMEEQRKWHEIAMQHRREDMNWRRQELEHMNLINRRREIDEKNEQLKNIANIAALIAGFCVVVLIELNFDKDDAPGWLLDIYSGFSAATVCLMTYAYVTCTLILVGTLKKFEVFASYDEEEKFFLARTRRLNMADDGTRQQHDDEEEMLDFQKTRFMVFWESTCEGDWNRAYLAFSLGVPTFLASICFAGWIKFLPSVVPGIVISVICGVTIVSLFWNAHMKWGVFLARRSGSSSPSKQQQQKNRRHRNRGREEEEDSNASQPEAIHEDHNRTKSNHRLFNHGGMDTDGASIPPRRIVANKGNTSSTSSPVFHDAPSVEANHSPQQQQQHHSSRISNLV